MKRLLYLAGYGTLNQEGLLKSYSEELNFLNNYFEFYYIDGYYEKDKINIHNLIKDLNIDVIVKDFTETSYVKVDSSFFISKDIFEDVPTFILMGAKLNLKKLIEEFKLNNLM